MTDNENIRGSVAFTPEDRDAGLHIEFINFLIKMGYQFRAWTDGYCYVIDYITDIDVEDGTSFEILGSDQVVVDEPTYMEFLHWKDTQGIAKSTPTK